MTRAKVELLKSSSHSRSGRKFLKGQPQILMNLSEIKYYQMQQSFRVTLLDEVKPKAPVKKKAKKPIKVEVETPIEEEPVEEKPEVISYSKEELKGIKKTVLVSIAAELNVFLDGSEKKKVMIAEILEAQK